MVATIVKVGFFGLILGIIGVGIGSTFVPQLQRQQRDFTIRSDDKKMIDSRPKNAYMSAIKEVVDSDKPFYGSKPKRN